MPKKALKNCWRHHQAKTPPEVSTRRGFNKCILNEHPEILCRLSHSMSQHLCKSGPIWGHCQNESNTTNTLQMRINGKLNSSQQFHLNLLAGTFLFSSATSHGFPSKVKRYLMVMVTVCRCFHSLTQKRKISTFSPSGCCEICNKRNTLWSACGPAAVSRGNREYRWLLVA